MAWILLDFSCDCGWEGEELVSTNNRSLECPVCSTSLKPNIPSPGLATFSIADKSQQHAMLKTRAREHTRNLIKKDGVPEPKKKNYFE